MTFLSCLTEESPALVLDASVIINLLATGHASTILQALPRPSYVTDNVVVEIKGGAENGRPESEKLLQLIECGKIGVVELDDQALESFFSIVSGPASDSLGDGESSTLAFAHCGGMIAAIDEKKATRIAAQHFGELKIATTVDILAYEPVGFMLGQERLSQTVLDALRLARMQVWEHQFTWVVQQIGASNLSLCPSLRRLAKRMPASDRTAVPHHMG
ncbi:hypothetical protein [Aquabacterium sp.]|jgi:predicted nucleic acid-binding protein|uniref:hypothetical protein n=1 Tax=Aquabacterium sp. TaxID=1872578 RepID=UPI003D04B90E